MQVYRLRKASDAAAARITRKRSIYPKNIYLKCHTHFIIHFYIIFCKQILKNQTDFQKNPHSTQI